jgi:plasmid stabilization system protein ParE
MKVRYSATASADLGDILSYLIERNPRAAATVGQAIETTVARVAMFPESAEATDEPGVRMAPAGRYPYLIFYAVGRDEIQIVRVLHGARLRPGETKE